MRKSNDYWEGVKHEPDLSVLKFKSKIWEPRILQIKSTFGDSSVIEMTK